MSLIDTIFGKSGSNKQVIGADNDNKITVDPFAKAANNADNDANGNNGNSQSDGNGGGNGGTTIDAGKALQEFAVNAGLFKNLNAAGMMKAMADGDADAFNKIMAQNMLDAVQVGAVAAEKIATAKAETASNEAMQASQNSTMLDLARASMHEQMPFTADPSIAPIAEMTLKSAIENAEDVPTALKTVGTYFNDFSKVSGQHYGTYQEASDASSLNGNNNMGGANNDNQANQTSQNESDWVNVLTHERETFDSLVESGISNVNTSGGADGNTNAGSDGSSQT